MSSRFVQFVLMHAQNAAFCLGDQDDPSSPSAEPLVNLEIARVLIDQLEMLEVKTTGNLSNEESELLRSTLGGLRLRYVEVANRQVPSSEDRSADRAGTPARAETPTAPQAADGAADGGPASVSEPEPEDTSSESSSRKRFTKSYGP